MIFLKATIKKFGESSGESPVTTNIFCYHAIVYWHYYWQAEQIWNWCSLRELLAKTIIKKCNFLKLMNCNFCKSFTNRYKISDTRKLSKSASHHKCRAASFLLILDNPTRKFPISGFLHFN